MLYRVNVIANGDGGEDMPLGVSTVEASDTMTAENQAREDHWDARLDCAGCFCRFETVEVPRYIVAEGWQHYFDDTASTIRFVFDNKTMKMAFMEVETSDGAWMSASREDRDDVVNSLNTANEEVFTAPAEYGAEGTDVLPSWANLQ
jgi:hypothetical protein